MTAPTKTSPEGKPPERRPWVPPTVEELPKLAELTLQSPLGDPIEGGGSPAGTVF